MKITSGLKFRKIMFNKMDFWIAQFRSLNLTKKKGLNVEEMLK